LPNTLELHKAKPGGSHASWQKPAKTDRSREVIHIETSTALLMVAIITAAIAFTTLVLKIIELAREK
jgi:hypothetical protein